MDYKGAHAPGEVSASGWTLSDLGTRLPPQCDMLVGEDVGAAGSVCLILTAYCKM